MGKGQLGQEGRYKEYMRVFVCVYVRVCVSCGVPTAACTPRSPCSHLVALSAPLPLPASIFALDLSRSAHSGWAAVWR